MTSPLMYRPRSSVGPVLFSKSMTSWIVGQWVGVTRHGYLRLNLCELTYFWNVLTIICLLSLVQHHHNIGVVGYLCGGALVVPEPVGGIKQNSRLILSGHVKTTPSWYWSYSTGASASPARHFYIPVYALASHQSLPSCAKLSWKVRADRPYFFKWIGKGLRVYDPH